MTTEKNNPITGVLAEKDDLCTGAEMPGSLPKGSLILAPLAGVTDGSLRYLCRREGAALCFTEMVSAKGLYYKSPGTEELLEIKEREGPVGIQLFGSEPEMIAYACRVLRDRPNVLIDINMGCPVPKVVRNNEGSALLRDPDLAARLVEAAVKNAGKPVTVKMRIGIARYNTGSNGDGENGQCADSPVPEKPYDYVAFAKRLESAGAAAIAVHGRTREQYYSGKANWQAIKEISSALSIPVIGNGDVRNGSDAKRMMEETGCAYVMIGRGAMGNPWVFKGFDESAKGSEIPIETLKNTMEEHLELLLESRGVRRGCMEMRKHFAWYTKGLKGASELRKQVNTAETAEEIKELIRRI